MFHFKNTQQFFFKSEGNFNFELSLKMIASGEKVNNLK